MSATKYRLSLRKSRYPCRPHSKKNTDTLNVDFDIYKYRDDEVYKTDPSQSDTQSLHQFRSDLSSMSDKKKFPCYHVNNKNSATERCDNRERSDVANKLPATLFDDEGDCEKAGRSTPIEIILDSDEDHQLSIEKSDSESNTEQNISKAVPFPCSFLASLSPDVTIQNSISLTTYYRENYKYKKRELCRYLYKIYNERIFENRDIRQNLLTKYNFFPSVRENIENFEKLNENIVILYLSDVDDLRKHFVRARIDNNSCLPFELPHNMTIQWNVRMRRAGGKCSNTKITTTNGNIIRSSRIVLATKILDTPDRLRDTLLHEMCHAAAWLIDHEWRGHGSSWKKWLKILYSQFLHEQHKNSNDVLENFITPTQTAAEVFPELPPVKQCHDYKIRTKFTYRCLNCSYSIGRHSKSLDVTKKRCGKCYGKFELLKNDRSNP